MTDPTRISDDQHNNASAPAPAQERCSTCGYLTSEREHLGCLRRAVKDLDIATGGPYDAQEAATDPNGWCQYVAGMVFCWLQMQKELPPEDQGVAAIAGIIERRLWAYKPAQEVGLTDEMIAAGGRALCDISADACNVDRDDNWALHSEFYKSDAHACIIAALRAKGEASEGRLEN